MQNNWFLKSKWGRFISAGFLILLIILPLTFYFWHNEAGASWWNSDWFFKKEISITNNTTTENNVYITLTLDTSDTNKFQSDCGDLRFIQGNGNVLSYYIVSGCMSTSTIIHANFDVFDAGTQTIDFYYSNPIADNGFSTSDFSTEASNYTIGTISQEQKGPSPVLYLPLDEGFGTTAHDETSYRNDGTIVGATWREESDCKSGKCLEFDGNGDYVEIADNPSLDLSEELTLEAWIKPHNTNLSNQTIFAKTETPSEPTKIYRSVGPSATTAIAIGTTNAMTIIGDRATFQTALPDNVGVGDAIQYDDDDDNDIDANDSIAFITERISNLEFKISNSSGGVTAPVVGDNNWSLFRAYTSLANAEKGVENTGIDSDLRNFDDWTAGGDATTDDVGKDIVTSNEQWNIACYANGTTADTSATIINGWTTGANSFINIYTPVQSNEVGVSQRHNGKWDNNKYKISVTAAVNSTHIIDIRASKVKIDGLQIEMINGAYIDNSLVGSYVLASVNFDVSNVIGIASSFSGSGYAHGITHNTTSGTARVWNNFIYNLTNGANVMSGINLTNSGTLVAYNNTIYNSYWGMRRGSTGSIIAKNNITQNCIDGYVTAYPFDNSSDYNISSVAGDTTGGLHDKHTTTVSFISTTAGSEDFHLSPTDTAAKDSGMDLSGDSVFPFARDIDGQTRLGRDEALPRLYDGGWDIGADEAQATQIYRSVAPNKTDALETGTDNSLTIIGSVATFQRALADNIGVGDVIQYDDDSDGDIDASDSLAFIVERITNYEYRITNASGAVPAQVINDNDWSLFRAYTSLFNAESGAENTGIDSDLRNFDTWTGGKDIVTSKEQWNIACYGNGTTADTTAVVVGGWTVGVQNFVKIYTPVNESEVGVSQRHEGKWDENKYRLETGTGSQSLYLNSNYADFDGLQVTNSGTASTDVCIEADGYRNNITIRNNIIKGGYTGIYHSHNNETTAGRYYIYNNIVYSTYQAGIFLYNGTQIPSYVYNNTVYNSNIGNFSDRGCIVLTDVDILSKNNIAMSCGVKAQSGFATQSYNISSDSSAAGTGSLINQTLNEIDFVSTTPGSEDLHILGTSVARNIGTSTVLSTGSSSPGMAYDIDGEERETFDIGADEAVATKIYRSVGPGNTSALATDENHNNSVVVSNGVATFSDNLPDRIGVGDAVLIDTNSDNAITSADTLLFIHGRNSSTSYNLQTHTGAIPSDIPVNDTYQIFRAYTSLSNAEAGIENTAIAVTTFNGGNRDLVTNNEEWNFACYGDGADIDGVVVLGWSTGEENHLKIYTPYNVNEVGVSQRHNGKWDNNKYFLTFTGLEALNLSGTNVVIEGIQMHKSDSSTYSSIVILGASAGSTRTISSNIFKGEANYITNTYIISGGTSGSYIHIYNNIFQDFKPASGYVWVLNPGAGNWYVFNNTFYNCYVAIKQGTADNIYVKNNITQNCTDGYSGTFDPSSDFNISDLAADAPGTNSKNSTTVTFRDAANDDFRLAMNDTAAKGAGLNLYYDVNNPVTSDIEGEQRPSLCGGDEACLVSTSWDIGADQISSTIHNNYSLNLKTNYPQTNFSTADNDQDNFSSGDTNLPANTWSHIVYKRNADTEELFINGAKYDSGTISNFLKTNNGKLYLGAENPNSKNSFKGLMDEIRIYNYARTETEVKKDTAAGSSGRAAARAKEGVSVAIGDKSQTISDGLVGYWKMDEATWNGTAGEVRDVSGNENHGVASGGASTTAGKFGNGGGFDGVDDYVEKNTPSNVPSLNSPITISLWAKANSSSSNSTMVDLYDGSSLGNITVKLVVWGANSKFRVSKYGDAKLVETGDANSFPANSWIFYTYVFDGVTHKIYRNGILDGSSTVAPDTGLSKKISIGRKGVGGGSLYWSGQIDETRIYNRALSPDEVQQLYKYAPGPVLHLKMDEKTGTTAFDSSGNNNNGTLTGATWENGKLGGATKFTNNADRVTINQSASINNLKSFTYGVWVKAGTNVSTYNPIIEKGAGSNRWKSFNVGGSDRKMRALVLTNTVDGYTETVANSYTVGQWEYWSMTYDDAGDRKIRIYKNGVEAQYITQTAATGITYDDSATNIGIGSSPVTFFYNYKGLVDDVKIYNYVRSKEQMLEDAALSHPALDKPVLDLNFDEGVGSIAYDKSVNKNNGTLNPGATGGNTTATMMWDKGGKFGGAMEFDGSDYVDLGNDLSVQLTDKGTVSCWVKFTSSALYPVILGNANWDTDRNGYLLYANFTGGVGKLNFQLNSDSAWKRIETIKSYNDDKWHMVTGTFDGSFMNIYVDGVIAATPQTQTVDVVSGLYNLTIGKNPAAANYFWNGKIDDVKIYNYALSESEIKSLYNGGSSMSMGGESATANNNGTTVTGANKEYCVPGDTAKCDKPVLELKMDEKVGTTAYDTSGNGINSILANGPTWDKGWSGGAVKFDGVNDYASTSYNSNLELPDSGGTVSVWVKFDDSVVLGQATVMGIFRKPIHENWLSIGGYAMSLYQQGPSDPHYLSVEFGPLSDIQSLTGVTPIENNKWYNIVLNWNSANLNIYLNGKLDVSSAKTKTLSYSINTQPFVLGHRYSVIIPGTRLYLKGEIDDVKIYNYARTPAQIAWDYNRGKPIAEWSFNEGQGSTAHNEIENLNHGTITGATWKNESECKSGKCLYFDGNQDYIVANSTINPSLTDFTVSLWIKDESADSTLSVILDQMSGTGTGREIVLIRGVNNNISSYLGNTYRDSGFLTDKGNWRHITFIHNNVANTVNWYIDGKYTASISSVTANSADGDWVIGIAKDLLSSDFKGYMDDLKIYNYALTPEQVKLDYAGGAVNFR